jgi:pimeloyl-ACP methyl ester carboxylesterase
MNETFVSLGPAQNLVGVLTEPAAIVDGDVPAVIIPNAGITHRSGPFRLHTEVARRLAGLGYPCLRMDLAGVGDSPVRTDNVPEQEGTLEDTRLVMKFLNSRVGTRQFILFGLCSGADDSHLVAVRDNRIVGVVALDAFAYPSMLQLSLRQVGRLAGQPRHVYQKASAALRSSPIGRIVLGPIQGPQAETKREERFQSFQRDFPPRAQVGAEIEALLARGVQSLYIYSGGYKLYNYTNQFFDDFPSVRHHAGLEVEYFRDADHTFMLMADREQLISRVETWVTARFPIGSAADVLPSFKGADLAESCQPAIAAAHRLE